MTVGAIASALVCAGCGAVVADPTGRGDYPFRCPNARADDDVDHVIARVLDPAVAVFPRDDTEPNPFVRYRTLFHSYHLARAREMSDEQYVALVRDLDARVAAVDGSGFRTTPFWRDESLAKAVGRGVWVKDETRNVSGSHKARHLMGIMIYLQVFDALAPVSGPAPRLAIASCGNAALAAAVVARAAGRPLDVFIPPDAPQPVVRRLRDLGATPVSCPREAGMQGDPCYLRFMDAVARGAIPFCCQGSANGMTIEGGETLGFEMIDGGRELDAVVIQVGGGALASAAIAALMDARALGARVRLPRVYTVQTRGAFPLKRAYDGVIARAGGAAAMAGRAGAARAEAAAEVLRYAASHRHEFMRPWEEEPRSIARGILDDETYDWLAVVKGMIESGGRPVVVEESELADAYALGRATTGINVDHTGAAGLAGLTRLVREGAIQPHEEAAVIFSGVERA